MEVFWELDIITITVIMSITSICQAIALFLQYKISPGFPCIKLWWIGSIAQAIGFVFFVFTLNPSLYFLAAIANPLIIIGLMLYNKGIAQFFNIKTKNWPYIIYLSLFLGFYYYFIIINNSIAGRGVVVSLFSSLILFSSGFSLFKYSKKMSTISVRWTAAIYILRGCFSTLYCINILIFSNVKSYEMFNQSFMNVAAFIIPIIANMLIVFGFILMVNQRLNSNNMLLMHQLEIEKEIAEKNSIKDSLTGLMNRRYLDNIMEKELQRLKRSQSMISLIMLDIDYFKNYNDYYGHIAGDKCLQKIGKVLNSIIARAGDTAARYGGEEFFIILPETDEKGAMIIANKVKEAIESLAIPHEYSSVTNLVSTSMGLVTIDALRINSVEEAIGLVDKAMYHAKENGRNQIYMG